MENGQQRLNLEELDSRVLPSSLRSYGLSPTLPPPTPTQAAAYIGVREYTDHLQSVMGYGTGTYERSSDLPGSYRYQLGGQIDLSGIGVVNISGALNSVGYVKHGAADGQLVLSSSAGTITLGMTGAPQNGPSALPSEFIFTVTGTTGRITTRGSGDHDHHPNPLDRDDGFLQDHVLQLTQSSRPSGRGLSGK